MCAVRARLSDDRRLWCIFFFFKQKTAYEIPKRYWSSDVCSSDLDGDPRSIRASHFWAHGGSFNNLRPSRPRQNAKQAAPVIRANGHNHGIGDRLFRRCDPWPVDSFSGRASLALANANRPSGRTAPSKAAAKISGSSIILPQRSAAPPLLTRQSRADDRTPP